MTASPDDPSGRSAARAAKARVSSLLAGDARVNGVGITRAADRYAVRVNVVSGADVPDLPETVDGVPVRVAVVGRIRAASR